MVDKLLSVTNDKSVTSLTIMSDNLFCEDGKFFESGMIENIAQTVAAGAGYRFRQDNKEPFMGMIGAIKRLQISKRPQVGDIIQTEAKLIAEFENAIVVEGTIINSNEIIAQCQMNIFIFRNLTIH
jgi:predicted hotdog family 3-hydroxylacyl-ACP dehydratase